jgi:hypothetical protein
MSVFPQLCALLEPDEAENNLEVQQGTFPFLGRADVATA